MRARTRVEGVRSFHGVMFVRHPDPSKSYQLDKSNRWRMETLLLLVVMPAARVSVFPRRYIIRWK